VIDVRLLRNQPDAVRTALARRGKPEVLAQVDAAIGFDVQSRDIVARRDAIRAEVNDLSKQVGLLRRDGNVESAEALQARSRGLGDDERVLAAEFEQAQQARRTTRW
jgi:seryl-tRNA synthetase